MMRAAVLALVLATIALAGYPDPLQAEPIARSRLEVIDGNTMWVDGRRVRILGHAAAELGDGARCDFERRVGGAAKHRFQTLVAQGARYQRSNREAPPTDKSVREASEGTRSVFRDQRACPLPHYQTNHSRVA
jgi:endonuclease YncB( thermonuclease family)